MASKTVFEELLVRLGVKIRVIIVVKLVKVTQSVNYNKVFCGKHQYSMDLEILLRHKGLIY